MTTSRVSTSARAIITSAATQVAAAGGDGVQEHDRGGAHREHRGRQGPRIQRVLADLADDQEDEACADQVRGDGAHAISVPGWTLSLNPGVDPGGEHRRRASCRPIRPAGTSRYPRPAGRCQGPSGCGMPVRRVRVRGGSGSGDGPGGLASGTGRPAQGLPSRRRPGPAAGMTGATGREVIAASRIGGGCAAGSRGGREDRPPGKCSSAGRFGEIAPVFVSEGELEHRNRGNLPGSGIFTVGTSVTLAGRGRTSAPSPVPDDCSPTGILGGIVTRRDSGPAGRALDPPGGEAPGFPTESGCSRREWLFWD